MPASLHSQNERRKKKREKLFIDNLLGVRGYFVWFSFFYFALLLISFHILYVKYTR